MLCGDLEGVGLLTDIVNRLYRLDATAMLVGEGRQPASYLPGVEKVTLSSCLVAAAKFNQRLHVCTH
jgi:hypothetical protein